ncbi:neisseria meningitidis TspB family protein [Burkholderia oklahomensis]|uniref:Neisseria meningitidis TspB family protein n=2 Tax=Burkholderia oklahomensis TaxID=342113 RepID=A0AAI8B438_9BURK|nr:neisseria meningitidis TspB family protein [Burkholderia oklahomensis]
MQLAGVIAATEAKRGHSALDAVAEATIAHINTITSVGGTIAGGLAVATCSVGSGFLGVAACSAIGAVVGTSVQIALDGLIRWVFPSKPSLTIEEVAKATDTANAPCPTDGFVQFFYACTGNSAGAICWPDPKQYGARRGNVTNFFVLDVRKMPTDVIAYGNRLTAFLSDMYPKCGREPNYREQGRSLPVTDALKLMPDSDRSKPINPAIVAALANALWQQASTQPGYQGVPYDPTYPITADDVTDWNRRNPQWVPSVDEFASVSPGGGSTRLPMPNGNPGTGTSPGTGTNPGTGTEPGTGTNPGTGANPGTGTHPGTGTNPGNGTNPGDGGGKPLPPPDVCALHPDASGCAPLGSANDVPVNRDSKSVSLSPVSVGLRNGVCPPPRHVTVLGADLSFSYEPICEFAIKLRPLILLGCALLAGLIFIMGFMA